MKLKRMCLFYALFLNTNLCFAVQFKVLVNDVPLALAEIVINTNQVKWNINKQASANSQEFIFSNKVMLGYFLLKFFDSLCSYLQVTGNIFISKDVYYDRYKTLLVLQVFRLYTNGVASLVGVIGGENIKIISVWP